MTQNRRPAQVLRLSFILLVIGLIAPFLAQRAMAQSGDVYTVMGVRVDVSADSVAIARSQAHAEAEAVAVRILLERLTPLEYHADLPLLDKAEISRLVRDFEIAEEKASAVRYLARLNFHFHRDSVRQLLTDYAFPFAETMSKPVLVLPVYQAAGALLLWDDPNPWRTAWTARDIVPGLVPMTLPEGTLADIAAIGAEQAIEGDLQRLKVIAKRYGAEDTLVVHGILRMDFYGGAPELEVYLTRYGTALQEHTVVKSFTSKPGEQIEKLLARAAVALTAQVEDNWKQDNLLRFGAQASASVEVRINSLSDWLDIRKRLESMAVVRRLDLVLLTRTHARLNLHFIGDAEQLALALEQNDLTLWREGQTWMLGPRGSTQ